MNTSSNNLQNYSVKKLDSLLDRYGIELAWKSILKTHIESLRKKDFSYILKDEYFSDAVTFDFDCIHDLSIGEIGVLYEYSLAYVNPDSRKESGQYFTPDDIALLMAKYSKNFNKGIWLDPCSGVGNLSYWLIKSNENPEKFLLNNLILTDRDSLALRIARTIFALSFQNKNKKLYFDIESKFITLDFLKDDLPSFDYSILNPPYLAVKADKNFETASCGDLFVYFLERIIKNSKGFISITPQTFTNGKKYKPLRKLLINKFRGLKIFCFDNVPDNIFKGIKFGSKNSNTANSTRAAIIVAQVKGEAQITPLMRWKTEQRAMMLDVIDSFLCPANLSEDIFPKIDSSLINLYRDLSDKETLGSLLSKKPTEFVLYVPNTPRYFLSATKKYLNRSGMKKLYFHNADDWNLAYLLLNSSLCYWWWRVMDGGMCIGETTIQTLPIPDFKIDYSLIRELENSEETNKVEKLNAGTVNENIKHSKELVEKLNQLLAKDYSDALINTHRNSVL